MHQNACALRPFAKSFRKPHHDYTAAAQYFITTNVENRDACLATIDADGQLTRTAAGEIVAHQWPWLAEQYAYVQLFDFVVMPDHFHGLLLMDAGLAKRKELTTVKIKSLSELMGAFKTTSSKWIRRNGHPSFAWQSAFHVNLRFTPKPNDCR